MQLILEVSQYITISTNIYFEANQFIKDKTSHFGPSFDDTTWDLFHKQL